MSGVGYVARRAMQKERVRLLYRRALKDTLNWAVHRHAFYPDADRLRERFDANKHVEDIETIDRLIADGEASYNKWRHPDPYIVPWAPGGSKFTRNPPPPSGIFISFTDLIPPDVSKLRKLLFYYIHEDVSLVEILEATVDKIKTWTKSKIEIVYDYGKEDAEPL